jgi:hypothetical protein
MKIKFATIEKIIAIFQIIWGVLLFSLYLWTISVFIENRSFDGGFKWYLFNFHDEIILELLTISSGVLLLKNKRIGWIIAVVTICVSILEIIFALVNGCSKSHRYQEGNIYLCIFLLVVLSAFIYILYFLLSKYFLIKYKPNRNILILMILSTIVLFVDYLIIFLSHISWR